MATSIRALYRALLASLVIGLVAVGAPGGLLSAVATGLRSAPAAAAERAPRPLDVGAGEGGDQPGGEASGALAANNIAEDDDHGPTLLPWVNGDEPYAPASEQTFGGRPLPGPSPGHREAPRKPPRA